MSRLRTYLAYLPMLEHCFPYFSFTFEAFSHWWSRDCYHFSFGSCADFEPRHRRIKGVLRVISPGLELGYRWEAEHREPNEPNQLTEPFIEHYS